MAKPTRRRAVPRAVWWSLAAVVIIGLGAAFQLWQSSSQVMQPLEVSGVYLNKPQPVVDFTLVNDEGGAFTKAELQGKWTFIYFGYTSCPDVCPTTLALLNKAQQQLASEKADENTEYLLISVDPDRDLPARLKQYVSSFNPAFSGATGEREELDKLTKALGVYYKIYPPEADNEFYLVDHSSALLLINPAAELQAVLTPPFTPATLADDLKRIRERYNAINS